MMGTNTFPRTGSSIDPHVSQAQCNNPDRKSAEIIPARLANRKDPMDRG